LGKGVAGNTDEHFNHPSGVAVSDINKRIYVADALNDRVQVFDFEYKFFLIKTSEYKYKYKLTLSELSTDIKLSKPITLRQPNGVTVSDTKNRIYISDYGNYCVRILNGTNFKYIDTIGKYYPEDGDKTEFFRPAGVAISENNIFISDELNNCVKVFGVNNLNYLYILGNRGYLQGEYQFHRPNGVAVLETDKNKQIYVSDNMNNRVQVFTIPPEADLRNEPKKFHNAVANNESEEFYNAVEGNSSEFK